MQSNSLISDARTFEMGWRVWFWILIILNFIAPIFFLPRIEAWAVISAYAVAGVVVAVLHRRLGWVRLLGACHFPWIALLPWMAYRYVATSPEGVFGIWMLTVVFVDTIAFGIDSADVVRYLKGEAAPIVPR